MVRRGNLKEFMDRREVVSGNIKKEGTFSEDRIKCNQRGYWRKREDAKWRSLREKKAGPNKRRADGAKTQFWWQAKERKNKIILPQRETWPQGDWGKNAADERARVKSEKQKA